VLVLEGAGSPVELNLMERDLANLRPVRELDGRWVLVSDIERGGVFAQIVGTWNLLEERDRARGLGVIVNKFRGDLSLFADAQKHLSTRTSLPYLGALPFRNDLQPESEDSLCRDAEESGSGETLAWIRFPHLSNSQDAQPWRLDQGVRVRWAQSPADLAGAKAIVLPGTKNTLADLAWLRETGFDRAISSAAEQGLPVVGICGGYQMLGETLCDESGAAGNRGTLAGLNLLPVRTTFHADKEVRQVEALWKSDRWTAYEIHMGRTERTATCEPLLQIQNDSGALAEGCRSEKIWGTYLHGLFESPLMRKRLMQSAGIKAYQGSAISWCEHQGKIYNHMADLLEERLDLKAIWNYVAN